MKEVLIFNESLVLSSPDEIQRCIHHPIWAIGSVLSSLTFGNWIFPLFIAMENYWRVKNLLLCEDPVWEHSSPKVFDVSKHHIIRDPLSATRFSGIQEEIWIIQIIQIWIVCSDISSCIPLNRVALRGDIRTHNSNLNNLFYNNTRQIDPLQKSEVRSNIKAFNSDKV